MRPDYTSISVSPDMRDRLKSMKRGGQSYEDVIENLLCNHERDNH